MIENRWPKIARNYKPTGRKVRETSRKPRKENFEVGTDIKMPNL
jgi:hypothetical protein